MRSCDRKVSGEPDACEGRSSELPAYVVEHFERRSREMPQHTCAKCRLPIVVEAKWFEPGLN